MTDDNNNNKKGKGEIDKTATSIAAFIIFLGICGFIGTLIGKGEETSTGEILFAVVLVITFFIAAVWTHIRYYKDSDDK